MSPTGGLVHLDADYRERNVEAYAICRIVGRDITSVDFDAAGSFVAQLDSDDKLMLPKKHEFENFTIVIPGKPGYDGLHIF